MFLLGVRACFVYLLAFSEYGEESFRCCYLNMKKWHLWDLFWFNDKFEYINYVTKYGFFKNVHAFTVNQDFVFW